VLKLSIININSVLLGDRFPVGKPEDIGYDFSTGLEFLLEFPLKFLHHPRYAVDEDYLKRRSVGIP
jgi:hypothetical protein